MRTFDPVADAEVHASDLRPLLGNCEVCGCEIHGSCDGYEADDAYEFDGEFVCANHLADYFEENKLK